MWTQIRRHPQEPSDLGLHCLSKLLQTTKTGDLCCNDAQSFYKCNGQDFHERHARLRSSDNFTK